MATATEGGTELFPAQYFDRDAYLNQSPQLYKQILMASSLDRVYEIGPAFRAEEHDTLRHLNEFTSIDIEMAFSDEGDAMRIRSGGTDGESTSLCYRVARQFESRAGGRGKEEG